MPSKLFVVCFCLLAVLYSCSASQQSLSIELDETPLYPEKQWAVVIMPYIKVSQIFNDANNSSLLGMVRFGNIVEVQRIEQSPQGSTIWAYIIWEPDNNTMFSGEDVASRSAENGQGSLEQGTKAINLDSDNSPAQRIEGWVSYGFLHMVGNLKEAQLASHQMLHPIGQNSPVHAISGLPVTELPQAAN